MHPAFQRFESGDVKHASPALIGKGSVRETVGEYPVAAAQCRFDDLFDMLASGGEHQQRFRFGVHGCMQQQFAQFFAKGCAARFAGDDDREITLAQQFGDIVDMGRFACAVDSLECQETACQWMMFVRIHRMYLSTARLCSSRLREKWLVPSPRATKYSASVSAG